MFFQKSKKIIIAGALSLLAALGFSVPTFADSQFSVSPMNQKIILTPGETYKGTFIITNPASSPADFNYKLTAGPFYVNEKYDIQYTNNGDYNKIVDWIELPKSTGAIAPNSSEEVEFIVHVPAEAPAGGQYATINVASNEETPTGGTINIQATYSIAHIIYAEIAGTTVRKGEIPNISVPGFIFSGNISGTSSITNTGNVHGEGVYILEVYPLFSSEPYYTNEEEPEKKNILPDRTLVSTSYWEETPTFGIFNVVYSAEFEGVTREVKKMVIVCPLWALITICALILILILWLISRAKKRK